MSALPIISHRKPSPAIVSYREPKQSTARKKADRNKKKKERERERER